MNLGIGLSICNTRGSGGAAVFNPATLPLTAFFETPFAGSPWVGQASAGTSGSNNATEATNPPGIVAVNGRNAPDFDGTNDRLVLAGTLDTYVNTNAGTGVALVYIDAIATNDVTAYANDCLMCTTPTAELAIALRSNGSVLFHLYDGGNKLASRAFTTGGLHSIVWTHDGSTIKIGVDELPGAAGGLSSAAAGSISGMTAGVRLGTNYNASTFLNGRVPAFYASDTVLSSANIYSLYSRLNALYGTSLPTS